MLINTKTFKMNETKLKRYENHIQNRVHDERMSFTSTINSQVEKLEHDKQAQTEFLLRSLPFIQQYFNKNTNETLVHHTNVSESVPNMTGTLSSFVNEQEHAGKGTVYKDFMCECMNIITEPEQDDTQRNDIFQCPDCKREMTYMVADAYLVCEQCGNTTSYQDFSLPLYMNSVTFNGEMLTQFAYKRVNHFREWLTQIQGRENTIIPDAVIIVIMKELKKERISDVKDITYDNIKRYLKKKGMNKYYEHIPTIINKICRKDRVKITHDIEEILIQKFCEIQAPFERFRPKKRKNFMSYSYTLHKLCQLLDYKELANMFPLLKSRSKLRIQDEIWEKICEDRGWKYIPSL